MSGLASNYKTKGGEILSLDDIKYIAESEKKAASVREQALTDARQLISDAEKNGRTYADRAHAEAEGKVEAVMAEAEKSAAEQAAQSRTECKKLCSGLEASAGERLDKAAAIIVERIVNA